MASYPEMERVRKDPATVRFLARAIFRAGDGSLTEWELDFLEGMRLCKEPITLRQCEKLMQIRDDNERVAEYRGLTIKSLIENCGLGRCDLADEDDAAFIKALAEGGPVSIRRRQLGRLLRCCRQLRLIEPHLLTAA